MRPAERFAAAAALTTLALLLVWCGAPGVLGPSFTPLPAEICFPDEVSAAVRLYRFEPAFERYWERRGYPDTDTAVVEVLQAVGPWDEWREDLSEAAIRRRAIAFREAFFQLMGPEGWLVFGQWKAREGETAPETAMLMYLQEGAAIRLAVGPFLDLMLPDKKTTIREYRGVEILQYTSERERDDWTMARLGGWVCISMRNRNSRAIERIVDQYLAARDDAAGGVSAYFGLLPARPDVPSIRGRLLTEPFWRHLRDFEAQRVQRDPAQGENENRTERWQRRLKNISEIELIQDGEALLDLDMIFRGERIDRLEAALLPAEGAPASPPLTAELPIPESLPLSAIQVDFSYAMATRGLRVAGMKWKEFLEYVDDLKWLAPGVGSRMERMMYKDEGPAEARIGAGLTRSGGLPLPAATVWLDHPPIIYTRHAPADAWLSRALVHARGEGDQLFSSAPEIQEEAAPPALIAAQRELADRVWSQPARPPELFAVFNFDEMVRWMQDIPPILVLRSEGFQSTKHFAQGMNAAVGTAVLRLDVQSGEARLRLRTLRAPEGFNPEGMLAEAAE